MFKCRFLLGFILAASVSVSLVGEQAAHENLKTLVNISLDKKPDAINAILSDEKEFYEILYDKHTALLNPSEQAKRTAVFNLLCQQNLISTDVLDEKTWQDLEILCGPKSDPAFYLASKIDRTCTQVGKATLFGKVVNPLCNIEQLENQQQVIKELVGNPELFDYLDKQLKELVMPETAMLSFWEEDTFLSLMKDRKIKVPYFKNFESRLNKNEIALDVLDKTQTFQVFLIGATMAAAAVTLPLHAVSLFAAEDNKVRLWLEETNKKLSMGSLGMFLGALGALLIGLKLAFPKNRLAEGGSDVISGVVSAAYLPRFFWGDLQELFVIKKCIQERLIHVATYLNNIKSMLAKVKANPVISSHMPAVASCDVKLAEIIQASDDVRHLLELLETNTFKGEASMLSYAGRIFAAFNLMHAHKEQLTQAMVAVGELDAQLSIAKLYKEFQDKHVTICFPTYIDPVSVSTPSVKAVDFWNMFINPEKVVSSSLSVGLSYDVPQNVIITGPNAGGKSTVTKAFVMSIILAQSLGIAPAKELTLTLFKKIITYLNITDDIAAGNSHFKAGVLRAQDVEKTYKSCKEHEYVLTAIDEVFNGTTFREGQAAAYSLIKLVGLHPLGMCITNTHFPIIPTLEKSTGRFKNYKVTVIETPGQRIRYPFKLEPGVSDQVVTLKILKEEGFGDEFIDQAQQVLDGQIEV